ncbi:MAG: hypothetical protein H0W69_07840 [Gemmatimonadaceae bacterium]|nr:hypothetical protein [Gemmatimonadaceae bacterium]
MKNLNEKALSVLLCIAAGSSACTGKPKYSGPYGKQVAEAIPKIEVAVGLKFKTPPKVETRSRAQVRAFVAQEFMDPAAQQDLAGTEASYKRFGMIPDSLHLQKFMVDLLEEQIVGYYDPKTKVLYVVDGSPREAVEITVTHELVHALQDQYISLDSIQSAHGQNDRSTAAQAIFEGQAVYEQIAASLGGTNVAINLPGGWDRIRDMIRENQSAMPIFAAAPLVIQETLIFPYLSGAEFVRNFKDRRGGQSIYEDIPVSTEQVLHPVAYFARRDAPTSIDLGKLVGATPVYENTLGEFETRLFIFQHLGDQNESVRAATGWDGDRYVLFNTGSGQGLVWVTVWDSAVEAGEFYDIADQALEKRFNTKAVAGKLSRSYSAAGRSVQLSTVEIAGRPGVIFVDVPAGASTNVLDPSQIKLKQ